ncbi:MAG: heme exporter protein CcmB [Sphingomicrobium sp.]
MAPARARPKANSVIGRLILREVRRGFSGSAWLPIAFFLLVATLVPFAVGPDARLLGRIGGGALWIAALTAALLPIERLVEPDRADGVLDQLALHGVEDVTIAAAKIAAHWLTFGPLLLFAAFPAAALLHIDGGALARVLLSIWIGTPGLAALAVAVAAVTAGLPRAGSLAGLLLLPLAVPLLIFAAAFCGDGSNQAMSLEAAVSILLLAGAPFVAGAAIRAART